MMNGLCGAGLEKISSRYPELAGRLSLAPEGGARASSGGTPVLEAHGAQGWVCLHSRYDPQGEARRMLEGTELSDSRFVVMLGLGAGYGLEEALRRIPRDGQVVAIEPEPGIFRKALQLRDFSAALLDSRVLLFVGEKPSEIAKKLDPVTWGLSFRQPKLIEHPSYSSLSPDYLREMRRSLVELFEIEKTGVATRCAGKKAFSRNIFGNLPRLASAAGVVELFGIFKNRPAIVVSAGPSLNKQLPRLKELQGRAVIICVDTAMRVLLNAGIRPDLVAAVDFTPVNYRHFAGVDTGDLALVAASIVYPKCLEAHKGPLFSIFNELPVTDWLMPLLGTRGSVAVGDSTAHTAFHLAESMGCSPIMLIGQDLAYTGGKTHAEGVATRAEAAGGDRLMADGWSGGQVATSPALMTMLKHFEGKIANCKSMVINATEGGAHIGGAVHITFEEAAGKHCAVPFPARQLIEKAASRKPSLCLEAFREEVFFARRRAARSRRLAHEGIRCIRRLISALCEGGLEALRADVAELERVYAAILTDAHLLSLLQAGMEISLMQLRWPDPASGAPFKHDFLVELIKDRRFLNDLCVSTADLSRELKGCVAGLEGKPGGPSGQTDDWLRHAARLAAVRGEA
jgi:hypothetical protein